MMRSVVAETRRILKPSGSAVFILQPNSERVGRMRPWLWEFMAWTAREWNQVQDVWWWNTAALPMQGARTESVHRPFRPSVKACVWLGPPDCYRDPLQALWAESHRNAAVRAVSRASIARRPSGLDVREDTITGAAEHRGGVTPFNLLPVPNTNSTTSAGGHGHGAGTPDSLVNLWLRYLCPAGGVAGDWFTGSGTTALEAIKLGLSFVGCEQFPKYHAVAQARIDEALAATPLFA